MRVFLLFSACLTFFACNPHQEQETLDHALFEFAHGLRWGRAGYVGTYLLPKTRRQFRAGVQRSGDVRVTNCQVINIKRKSNGRTEVTLAVDWYRLTRGRVHRTTMRQTWHKSNDRWVVEHQDTVGGPVLPHFAGRAPGTPSGKRI